MPRLAHVRERLDVLVETSEVAAHLEADPLGFVHRAAPADREVVALIAATLAFGQVKMIRASIARVLAVLGDAPAHAVDTLDEAALAVRLSGFVHRVYRGRDVARMLASAGALRRTHGTLGTYFAARFAARGALREALAELADALRGGALGDGRSPSRGLAHLVPDPRKGSASKRLLLWLRWMVRPADGVDLGLWDVPASALVIPVDTHVHRIARNLGLTRRRDASWRTAEEITAVLRRFDAQDPVKYDFAICHLGVSRNCPSRRDETKCATCVVRTACTHWARHRDGVGPA
jgi:uncharacterized protein (TIGR02757 family)